MRVCSRARSRPTHTPIHTLAPVRKTDLSREDRAHVRILRAYAAPTLAVSGVGVGEPGWVDLARGVQIVRGDRDGKRALEKVGFVGCFGPVRLRPSGLGERSAHQHQTKTANCARGAKVCQQARDFAYPKARTREKRIRFRSGSIGFVACAQPN